MAELDQVSTSNNLAETIMDIAGKSQTINHIPGPQGVRGRNSDNALIREKLGWEPRYSLEEGLKMTYPWIEAQVKAYAAMSQGSD